MKTAAAAIHLGDSIAAVGVLVMRSDSKYTASGIMLATAAAAAVVVVVQKQTE